MLKIDEQITTIVRFPYIWIMYLGGKHSLRPYTTAIRWKTSIYQSTFNFISHFQWYVVKNWNQNESKIDQHSIK